MSNYSEVNICIMGYTGPVQQAKKILSDDFGCYNPFKAFTLEHFLKAEPSFIGPKAEQSVEDYKNEMERNYFDRTADRSTQYQFRFHTGPGMNPNEFTKQELLDKEICSFDWGKYPPLLEFVSLSTVLKDVAFAIDFDNIQLAIAGTTYISNGMIWYSGYDSDHKDIAGYDIRLDPNFEFRYLTKYKKLGMLVPPEKLPPIGNNFQVGNPKDLRILSKYFSRRSYDHEDPHDEYIPDNYIPVLYQPTEEEKRRYWDIHLAEIEALNRAEFI